MEINGAQMFVKALQEDTVCLSGWNSDRLI